MIAPIDRWHALEPFEHRGTKSSWLHWLVGHALAKTEWERAGEEFYVAGTNNVHADGRRGSTEACVIDNGLSNFSFSSFDSYCGTPHVLGTGVTFALDTEPRGLSPASR